MAEASLIPLGVVKNRTATGIVVKLSRGRILAPKLHIVWSKNGGSFNLKGKEISIFLPSGRKEKIRLCHNFSFYENDECWVISYIRKEERHRKLVIATSADLVVWIIKGETEVETDDNVLINKTLYTGGLFIRHRTSNDLSVWSKHSHYLATSRSAHFDSSPITLMGGMETSSGSLVFYDTSHNKDGFRFIQAGAILFAKDNPSKVLWRSTVPVWSSFIHEDGEPLKPLGIASSGKNITLYWVSKTGAVVSAVIPFPFTSTSVEVKKDKLYLNKHPENPILEPRGHNDWESDAVFNPAALYDDGRVHLLYRAIGRNNISVLGYASSADGVVFDERHDDPAYYPREEFEGVLVKGPTKYTDIFASGGGWGGCEDPKLTAIDNRVYLTYVAFNGWSPPRLALSSISRKDFLNRRWNWTKPQLMSRPGIIDKSGCILPEKVNGKYVIFHRVFPDILIDFVDSLDFSKGKWLKGEFKIPPRLDKWDSRKLSVGAPPIKTKDGWLVIYHAVDDRDDSKYKIGAMILDLKDPTKVLYRTNHPILVPDQHYENDGKPGVAYPCGAVAIDGELFVYYGGGDKVVCVATAPLDTFIKNVKKDVEFPFNPKNIITL